MEPSLELKLKEAEDIVASINKEELDQWRELPGEVREEFVKDVCGECQRRQKEGRKQYGDTFHGDAVEQAWQEGLDLLFYLWMEKRRKASERRSVGASERMERRLRGD
jgi:hypothetical protein